MKKFTIGALALLLTLSSASANYTLTSQEIANGVKVTVNSDFGENQIKEWALQLGYDTSSLEAKNLTNLGVLGNADVLDSSEAWITFVWSSENLQASQGSVLSFDLVKKEWVENNWFTVAITEWSAILENWEVSTDPSEISVNISSNNMVDENIISNEAIIAEWETNIKTWTNANTILLFSLLAVLATAWIIANKRK